MKNILIIGATSAIAKECAKIWAERGDKLFLVAAEAEDKLTVLNNNFKIRKQEKPDGEIN